MFFFTNAMDNFVRPNAGLPSTFPALGIIQHTNKHLLLLGTKNQTPISIKFEENTIIMLTMQLPLFLMFYVLSKTIKVVESISTCHTKVYMKGDNDFVLFHVEEEELIEPIASLFCLTHLVDNTECQRIVQYHKEHCFQEKNETTTVAPPSENVEQREDEVTLQTQTTIDYAEKKGPILQIFRVDGTLTVNQPPYLSI